MPRFVGENDLNLINGINRELIDVVIDTPIVLYKTSVVDTGINIYGESTPGGKSFHNGVIIPCIITHQPQETTEDEGFGVDITQTVTFAFHRDTLIEKDIYPEHGDIAAWNGWYYEITVVVENQLIAGQSDSNFSIICQAILTRNSGFNLEDRNI